MGAKEDGTAKGGTAKARDQGGKEEPVRASQSRERRDSHVSYTAPPDCASNTAG